jgi:hypothetical protein
MNSISSDVLLDRLGLGVSIRVVAMVMDDVERGRSVASVSDEVCGRAAEDEM